MSEAEIKCDVAIVGGGLAGITAALELLDCPNTKVIMIDRDEHANFGGLAKKAFGGMALVDTPVQKMSKIKDSPDLALSDWHAFAEFGPDDHWPKRWAEYYVNNTVEEIYNWLKNKGIYFFPMVHWVERGLYTPGNSVPRYHILWGTGHGLIETLIKHLEYHPNRKNLDIRFNHQVTDISHDEGGVTGCSGIDELNDAPFEINAGSVIVASGGINGDIDRVKANWYKPWGAPPATILNGSHKYADGKVHDIVSSIGGNITHLDFMWNYAAGIRHPKPEKKDHGLSLIPCKSALWMDYKGERIGPDPLITGFDTNYLCKRVSQLPKQFSWQVLNWKIAAKEIAVSGAEHNPSIRDKKIVSFLKEVLLGNHRLVRQLADECEDFIVANSVEELAEKMNSLTQTNDVDARFLKEEILKYDRVIDRPKSLHNDDQLRRIAHARQWRGDKVRTCNAQKIIDKKAMPLIAIREFIVSRKSLGGIQTDLESRVLNQSGDPIPGLYAAGESAGFGGGGISGFRSLEGTFISNCILNARLAVRSISKSR